MFRRVLFSFTLFLDSLVAAATRIGGRGVIFRLSQAPCETYDRWKGDANNNRMAHVFSSGGKLHEPGLVHDALEQRNGNEADKSLVD